MTRGQMYDAASTILAQKLSQVEGVGQVSVGGSSLPAVRVELNPTALNKYGIGTEDVRTAIAATNANRPKGVVEDGDRHWQIGANDQAKVAAEYLPLIVAYRDGAAGAPVRRGRGDRLGAGPAQRRLGQRQALGAGDPQPPARRQHHRDGGPGQGAAAAAARLDSRARSTLRWCSDRTPTIRASLRDVERTLVISIGLVIMVVFLFLRNWRATLIPSVAVPVSLVGTFGVMYLCGYSLDNLSLMALTIATGFVVDDAIVVLENISRHIEQGDAADARRRCWARARSASPCCR